ncbi:hypothetical protein HDK64DRAFT_90186 [Phyllosticta capitalensis]
MAEARKYVLKVTVGPNYDTSTHQEVKVNTSSPVEVSTKDIDASVNVRIQNYRGLPKNSPKTSPYFSHTSHTVDLYGIAYTFRLKQDIPGDKLVFGNDFDHPIRDRLPYGFSTAFGWVKSWIDPTMEGDVYADEPYLYSPVLSSMNILNVGEKGQKPAEAAKKAGSAVGEGDEAAVVFEEGAEGDGKDVREKASMPADGPSRMKHFRHEEPRKEFVFEKDRAYSCDFFNKYLDFNDFALRLPIITIPVIKSWDGQPLRTHTLRYVLKNMITNEPLFVVLFTLIPADQVESNTTESDASESDDESTDEAKDKATEKKQDDKYEDEGVD